MEKTAGEQNQIAEALHESEQRFRALVEGMALMVWQTDPSGNRMIDSHTWQAVGGCRSEGDHWLDSVHPEDRDLVAQHWRHCTATKRQFTSEFRLKCNTRGWRWIQAHSAPLLDAQGHVTKWVGMHVDITERKIAEQQLLKNQRQMSLALDITRMGFWSLDPVTQQVRMDARMRNVWGESSSEELFGLDIVLKRIHPEDRPLVAESVNAALDPNGSGYYKPTDYRLILEDGSIRWIAANGMTMYGGRGHERRAIELFGTVLDITDRKLIEDSLRESEERLQQLNSELEDRVQARTQDLVDSEARLRRLALELSRTEERERRRLAQILHDHVQQLLVGAKMRVEALNTRAVGDESEEQIAGVATVLDMAINATRSLAVELVPPVLQTQGLPTALQWYAVHIKDQHKLNVDVQVDFSANPATEEARDLLFQAAREFLLNVIKHAQVSTAKLKLFHSSKLITLIVADSGRGFPAEKGCTSETTFGLFHIRERVTALGGQLSIESEPGRGTVVTLTLPQ